MKRTLIPALLVPALALGSCAAPPATETQPAEQVPAVESELGTIDDAVDQQIQALMEQGGIPSLSVGIVLDNRLVWAKNYNGPAGLDSVYLVGSIQKPVTATAVLQLVEQGILDLDEDVSTYLPFHVIHPRYPDTPVTIRSLLVHQAGFGYDTNYLGMFRYQGDYSVYEVAEELLGIEFARFDPFPSNETFFEGLLAPGGIYNTPEVWEADVGAVAYTNIGYMLLAYIVERVTGLTAAEYIEQHILVPLGMTHSGYSLADLAQYHALPNERIEGDSAFMMGEMIPIVESSREMIEEGLLGLALYKDLPGNQGLRTTVPDLAQFLIAHMNDGRAPNGLQLLEPETVEMMHRSAGAWEGVVNSFQLVGQGMGWSLCEGGIEGHVGAQLGFNGTMMLKHTEHGTVGILSMMNVAVFLLENQSQWSWHASYTYEIEQLLLRTAEEMLGRESEG